jgi:crotonobetainyl-CoA:carnitine CoA-transferase CaiB-like acyl-CoA transferase
MRPLQGLRVIDLSKVLAGPLCGQSLGEMGAEVIKIEPPGSGDDTRAWMPKKDGQAALFLSVNHNKKSLALDLKSDEGRAIVHQLVASADIVLQGFGAGAAARLGVDYDTLSKLNPRLIYCEVSGYGRDGPLGELPGYDVMLQAFSGMLASMGVPGGGLARASFSPVDLCTGANAFSGVLAAVLERNRTGKGVYLEVSLLATAMSLMGYLAQGYWANGKSPAPMGTGHGSLAPYQGFRASDASMMIGVGNDAQWRRFCAMLGLMDVVDDPKFATNAARVANFDETVALVQAKIEQQPVAYWIDKCRAAGIPCSPIHTLEEALTHPHVQARGLVQTTPHPTLGDMPSVGFPVRFGGVPAQSTSAPPLLGQHTAAVLKEIGYDDAAIEALRARGLVTTV